MRAGEIASMLARDAEGVCRMLLPNGKREGQEWRVGSVDGAAGKSMGVRLTGDKAGTWKDFATDEGGDLLDLWCGSRGLALSQALEEAKDYLGVEMPAFREKSYSKPDKPKCHSPVSAVRDWLVEDRHLNDKAIEAYKLGEDGNSVVFPSLRDGELIRWKSRDINDKHKCRTSSDSEPCLFGWQAIPEKARQVVICEGEIDALSWWQMGHPALSVPNGAQGLTWIEAEFDNLERFDVIYLSMDMDDAGQKAVPEIVDRLGRERVRVMEIPAKDANELLAMHCDALKVGVFFEKAKTLDPAELKPASYYADKVMDIFTGEGLDQSGRHTPWPKVRDRFRFRSGEVSVIAGENFHGKSEAAGHFTVDIMAQGDKACVASMEFKPERWIARCAHQAAGMPGKECTTEYRREVVDWFNDRLWGFDVVGNAKADRIVSVFSYARRRYGIWWFVIDNLQKCGFDEDDHNGIKGFVDQLTDFAKEHDVHVLLVHHLNKSGDEDKPGGKRSIKGTGAITDMVDNVLIWWRNRPKEKTIEAGAVQGEDLEAVSQKPDAIMVCEKQRNGEGSPPKVLLWFDRKSHQFVERYNGKSRQYIGFSGGKEEILGYTKS